MENQYIKEIVDSKIIKLNIDNSTRFKKIYPLYQHEPPDRLDPLFQMSLEEGTAESLRRHHDHEIALLVSSILYTFLTKASNLFFLYRRVYSTYGLNKLLSSAVETFNLSIQALLGFKFQNLSKFFTKPIVSNEPWKRSDITFSCYVNHSWVKMEVPLEISNQEIARINGSFERFCEIWKKLRQEAKVPDSRTR